VGYSYISRCNVDLPLKGLTTFISKAIHNSDERTAKFSVPLLEVLVAKVLLTLH
jgi:hypothetical protein